MINGHKDIFLRTSKPDDVFRPGTTFSEILYLYSFDRKLRELLLVELLRIEHSIKPHVIYVFSKSMDINIRHIYELSLLIYNQKELYSLAKFAVRKVVKKLK